MAKGRGVSLNNDYIKRMMHQIQQEVQNNSALKRNLVTAAESSWRESEYYKEKMAEVESFLKSVQQVSSGYRKFNDRLLAFWLIYRGDRVLGQGGFGDLGETIIHLEALTEAVVLPRLREGEQSVLIDKATNKRIGKSAGGRQGFDIDGSTSFMLNSSFRIISSPQDIPKLDHRQIENSLNNLFGESEIVVSRTDVSSLLGGVGGTINTVLNSKNIRDHMFGGLKEETFPLHHKHVKHYFEKAGGQIPDKSEITRIKKSENRKIQFAINKLKPTAAPTKGRVVITDIKGADFLKDFREKGLEVEDFLKNFEGVAITYRWESNSAQESYERFRSSSEPRIVDFPDYASFNTYLERHYNGSNTQDRMSAYAAELGETPESLLVGDYHRLSYYRLSEYYHFQGGNKIKGKLAKGAFARVVGR